MAPLEPGLHLSKPSTSSPTTLHGFYVPQFNQVEHTVVVYSVAVLLGFVGYGLLRRYKVDFVQTRKRTISSWRSLFGWDMSEHALLRHIGMDAYLVVLFVQFALRLVSCYTVVGLLVLLPVYMSQTPTPQCVEYCVEAETQTNNDFLGECVCSVIDQYSLANVTPGSTALWVPALVMVYITAITMYLLQTEYRNIRRVKHLYWETCPPQLYSVLVDHIPPPLQDSDRLREYFDNVFPGKVYKVWSLGTSSRLETVGKARMKALMLLERCVAIESQKLEHDKLRHWTCNPCLEAVDTVTQQRQVLESLNVEFAKLKREFQRSCTEADDATPVTRVQQQQRKRRRESSSWLSRLKGGFQHATEPTAAVGPNVFRSCAFVTFRDITTASIATQSQVPGDASMHVSGAPEPADVLWDSLGTGKSTRLTGRVVSNLAYLVIILFWGVLISFIGAFTSAESLANQFDWVYTLVTRYPNLVYYIDELAPMVLIALVAVVNPVFHLITRLEGRISASDVERKTAEKYLVFLVVQVFVFYSVSGTVFKTFLDILERPQRIVVTLATTIPQNAAFYIDYIVAKWFWTIVVELLRVVEAMGHALRFVIYGATVTARERRMCFFGCYDFFFPSPRNFSSMQPQLLLVLFIAITYATIQPLVMPAALVFFILASLVYPIVIINSSQQQYDSGGRGWHLPLKGVVWGLVTSQLTLSGVLYAKDAVAATMLTWVTVVLTVFGSYRLHQANRQLLDSIPLAVAAHVDQGRANLSLHQVESAIWHYSQLVDGAWGGTTNSLEMVSKKRHHRVVFSYKLPVLREPDCEEVESQNSGQQGVSLLVYGSQ